VNIAAFGNLRDERGHTHIIVEEFEPESRYGIASGTATYKFR
jgi:hypothetical protein